MSVRPIATAPADVDPTFQFVRDLAAQLSAGRVELPSFPDVAARVQQVLNDEAVSRERIARVIAADAGLAARLLTMANSTLLHRGGAQVTDLQIAVTRIGYEHIRTAALAYANAQLRRAPELAHIRGELEQCWQAGLRVAALAHAIARESRCVRADEAMLAGLLHNIGKLYILARAPKGSGQSLNPSVLYDWYPSIGQAVAENWKLPEHIASAIGGQRDLERSHEGAADLQDLLIVAVHLAEQIGGSASDDNAAKLPAAVALRLNDSALVRIMLESKTELAMLQAALG